VAGAKIRLAMVISLVVPIYNDGSLARDFVVEATKYLVKPFEIIFVDDGSSNNSLEILKGVQKEFSFVRVLSLTRNFGQHIAISCGYAHATGEYIGYLNVDMEDPPDQIPLLMEKLKSPDVDVCHGIYIKREVSFFSSLTSTGFQLLLNYLTGAKVYSGL
jgi:glycosyltransferase involved in cell wall biosynthesis